MRPLDRFIQEAFEDLAKLPKDEVRMVVKLLNHQTTLFCNLANALKEELELQSRGIVDSIIYEVVDKEES